MYIAFHMQEDFVLKTRFPVITRGNKRVRKYIIDNKWVASRMVGCQNS